MKLRNQESMMEGIHSLFHLGAMGSWADGKLVTHFISERAGCDLAFSVLLHRHGPMVLTVCRRVLGDSHAAEDAFQATFLVLVKKAGTIRDRAVLTGWLYGVASRVAKKARSRAIRHQIVERQAAERSDRARAEEHGDEIRSLVQEEIARLPLRYREPLVLCYLEGLRHEEIAERLECPLGTVESRLSRGRERLRSSLKRRGVTAPASAQGLMLLSRQASIVVPPSLAEATIRCACELGSRTVAKQALAVSVATLSRASVLPQFGNPMPGLIACVGIVFAGFGLYYSRAPRLTPDRPEATPAGVNRPDNGPSLEPRPAVRPVDVLAKGSPPAPFPLPSRPDSAMAGPLGGITIDGRLDDWPAGLERHRIGRRLSGISAYDSTTKGANALPEAYFNAGYDRATGRVYLAVVVEDEDNVASATSHLHTDAVEVYIEGLFTDHSVPDWVLDATKLPVVQYAGIPGRVPAYGDPRGANPSLLYGRIANSTTQMAFHREGNITTYEWAIQPFDHYPDRPAQLQPGKRLGLEVVVVDKDRDRPKPTWIHWGPSYTRFKGMDASTLGELILIDGP